MTKSASWIAIAAVSAYGAFHLSTAIKSKTNIGAQIVQAADSLRTELRSPDPATAPAPIIEDANAAPEPLPSMGGELPFAPPAVPPIRRVQAARPREEVISTTGQITSQQDPELIAAIGRMSKVGGQGHAQLKQWQSISDSLRLSNLNLRPEIESSLQTMQFALDSAEQALKEGAAAVANHHLDEAERSIAELKLQWAKRRH